MKGLLLLFRALVLGPAMRHPLRALLPIAGVAVGVAAVAAIQRANRSVTESFREAAASISGRSDFVVTGIAGVPVQALESLSFLWRVGSFAPAVTGSAVVDDGSEAIAEILGVDPGGDVEVRDLRIVSARAGPTRSFTPDAVFVPVPFAARHRLSVGSRLPIVVGGIRRSLTVAGLLELSGVARAAGGDLLVTDLFTAQRLLGRTGFVDRVDIVLDPGVSADAVRADLLERLPPGLQIEPPGRSAESADRMVRAFRFNLNALGSLTLLVGMFLIANAVSTSVLRRRPEIAALRALGTARSSLFALFLAEGAAIGLVGTGVGEVGGLFLSRAALSAIAGTISNVYLPTAKIGAAGYAGPAALAAVVGIVSALAATLLPAAEATRIEPAPALHPGSVESVRRSSLARRGAAAVVLLLLALAAGLAPAVNGFPLFGFAAVGLVVGALGLASPLFVRWAAAVFRSGSRRAGAPRRLATRFFGGSLARNGLSVTALAMALGMTLAMIVTVGSIRETVRVWVGSTLRSDLWIKSQSGSSRGVVGDLPEEIVPFLRAIPGVAEVDPFRAREVRLSNGRSFTLASGDFRVIARMGGLPLLEGADPRRVAEEARRLGEALVSEPYSRRFGVGRGASVALATPLGTKRVRVAGVYRDFSNDRGTVVLDREMYLALFGDRRVTNVAVAASPGTDATALRRRILAAARGRYALSVSTNRELRREVLKIFDQTFAVTHALEAIAVAVAVLGIANALVASAIERRRSFGLLRAMGASGTQIRRAVVIEATLTGATATVAALLTGAAFAALLLLVINPQSFGWTVVPRIPAGRLAFAVAVVFGASVLAGVLPGRLAASVDPAAALAEE